MSNLMRWRFGETNPVCADVESETSIEIGDLLVLVADYVYPASEFCKQGAWMSQEQCVSRFLGVAMQESKVGAASKIRVATSGVFAFELEAGDYHLGDMVGAFYSDGILRRTSTKGVSIGRVFRRNEGREQAVYVQIRSKIFGWSE